MKQCNIYIISQVLSISTYVITDKTIVYSYIYSPLEKDYNYCKDKRNKANSLQGNI